MLALSKSMFGQSFRFSEVSSAQVAWRIKRMSMSDVAVILKKVKGKKWLHQVDIGYGEYYYPTIGDPYINMDRQKGQMCSSLSSTSSDPGIFYFLLPNSINISVSPLELSIVRFVRNRFNCWFCDLPSQVALLFFPPNEYCIHVSCEPILRKLLKPEHVLLMSVQVQWINKREIRVVMTGRMCGNQGIQTSYCWIWLLS